MAVICSPSSLRPKRDRSIRRTRGRRSISASHGRSGWRRWSSSVRIGAHDDEAFRPDVARQECHEIPSRAVRPVEVLEDQRPRSPAPRVRGGGRAGPRRSWPGSTPAARSPPCRRHPGSRTRASDDRARRSPGCAGRRGRSRSRPPASSRGQAPQGLDERRERQAAAVAQADASALEDERPVPSRPRQRPRRRAGSCRCRPRHRPGRRPPHRGRPRCDGVLSGSAVPPVVR